MWPFDKRASIDLTSYAEEVDYSQGNPYYKMANSIANATNEDPRDGESLERYIDRWTADETLADVIPPNDGTGTSIPKSPFTSPAKHAMYTLRREQVIKLLFKIEYQKREAHQARSWELERLKEKISRGLNHDYDSELVSEAEYRYFLKQHEDSLVEREMSSIRAQLANGEELSYDSSILSDLQAQALVEEHQNQRKHTELDRIRLMLLNSEDLAYDETLVSPRELDDVKTEVSSKRFLWLHSRQRPNAQPYGVSNYGAERLVSDWLAYLGCQDVILTQASQDGGVDVETANHVCQVKYYKNQGVSVQEAREIFGVASALGKVAMVFTSSDLTAAAYEFANQVGIIAVKFNVENSFLVGLNYYGEQLLVEGEYE